MDVTYLKKVKESGKTAVHELTPAQRKLWRAKMVAIYPEFYETIGKDLIDGAIAEGL
jgi:C4-dicarboxylate-binding protein DctP